MTEVEKAELRALLVEQAGGPVPWSEHSRALERIRALEKEGEAVKKEAADEKEYGKIAGAKVNALEEWRRKVEDEAAVQRGRNLQALDQEARASAATAQRAADTAQSHAETAGTRAELADSRAQRASLQAKVVGAVVLALTIALNIVQHVTQQPADAARGEQNGRAEPGL